MSLPPSTPLPSSPSPPSSAGILECSIGFLLTAVQPVTRRMLTRPTPCAEWDLHMLLLHIGDSLAAVHEGLAAGRIGLRPVAVEPAGDPVSALRVQAVRVLRHARASAACPGRGTRAAIGDLRIPGELVAGAGALEAVVHGWDVAQATGARQPVPPGLAVHLLTVARTLAPPDGRCPLFREPVEAGPHASPGERLVAFLGRRPPP
ncbi:MULTISPECIES: TIGR03086 family metal-binding protein [unclassified Actinomadura]|uniref:TIGR03086 family metal-binding protein n=1 Tax=unclassified Actinomadura TaxID=2626254 RepID=UPI0022868D47|nr:TIGR03086 family metal-binding protein [Actinomadura sp. K4S16]